METLEIIFDPQRVGVFLLFTGLLFIAMVVAVFCDLVSGVRRAKRAGEYRTSKKLRRTVEKLLNYCMVQLLFVLGDALLNLGLHITDIHFFTYSIPAITLLYTLYIIFIEFRSIRENMTNQKDKDTMEGVEQFMAQMIKTYGKDAFTKILQMASDAARKEKGLTPDYSAEVTEECEHLL